VPLPEIIEIVPLDKPVQAQITVPGSKSITNRALILAALADGETTLQGALWSEDTQVMVDCLQELGFMVNLTPDSDEPCNRTITVYGKGGVVPPGGTAEQPLDLFVGNAGTAARFLAAFVCLGTGVYRLLGVPRMQERPQAELFAALRQLGYHVESELGNDKLPARIIVGAEPVSRTRSCSVSMQSSSQFASALLLSAQAGQWQVKILGTDPDESPYVAMTVELIKAFPKHGGTFRIEPDASSGSYFVAAEHLVQQPEFLEYSEQFGVEVPTKLLKPISVAHWPTSGWQIDQRFPDVLQEHAPLRLGLELARNPQDGFSGIAASGGLKKNPPISRIHDLGDSIMTAIVLAPLATDPMQFVDLGRLRVQECERVTALRTELTRCGASVTEQNDTLTVFPSDLHGAAIETYNDHRMAMCFAILGLKVPGLRIKNPNCVKKTFPNFFQKLAASPPHGLGATILDGVTGRELAWDGLLAQ
jgi:3-phosphoshikimate 1-carboxyvinyltransferase